MSGASICMIDVNYLCRSTPTILAGRRLVDDPARRPRRGLGDRLMVKAGAHS